MLIPSQIAMYSSNIHVHSPVFDKPHMKVRTWLGPVGPDMVFVGVVVDPDDPDWMVIGDTQPGSD